jgi:hypothetical protein
MKWLLILAVMLTSGAVGVYAASPGMSTGGSASINTGATASSPGMRGSSTNTANTTTTGSGPNTTTGPTRGTTDIINNSVTGSISGPNTTSGSSRGSDVGETNGTATGVMIDSSGQLRATNSRSATWSGGASVNAPADNHDNRVYPPSNENSATLNNSMSAH